MSELGVCATRAVLASNVISVCSLLGRDRVEHLKGVGRLNRQSSRTGHNGVGARQLPQILSRIQALMSHIRRTCQEIRDIKNPLRSRKSKLINKVYWRPPGPNHDSNREHLSDKYGEGGQDGIYSCDNTPIPPLDRWRTPCTNQEGGEHSSSPPPSPTPTSPCPSHIP